MHIRFGAISGWFGETLVKTMAMVSALTGRNMLNLRLTRYATISRGE